MNSDFTIERVATTALPTPFGLFQLSGYRSRVGGEEFVALHLGDMQTAASPLVRIHSQCLTGEVFGSQRCDCGPQLQRAMEIIAEEGAGAIVYQMQEGRGIGILNKLRAYALQDEGADTVEANERLGLGIDLRNYSQCAEILFELGIRKLRLLSNNPLKILALEQAGLHVEGRVSLEMPASEFSRGYLRTKKEKLGHLLSIS
jgi:3,4-dihydroxy 2-butanone 4-phosphate synthase/GTP cyclohydrolase II